MMTSRTIRWILPISTLVAVAYFGSQRFHIGHAGAKTQNAQSQAAPARDGAVPVTIASVVKADFPVYLGGLGTVQGFNTVLVRTRVDGQIDKIAFKEGLLVQIDPRPFQALTLFTTPVVYLYLDRLSNAFANWGRSADREPAASAQDPIKQAAE